MQTAYEKYFNKQDDTILLANLLTGFKKRTRARKRYGFAILTAEAIEQLKPYAPFVEVGSGNGYWAYEMQKRGIEIVPTDPTPLKTSRYKFNKQWTDIKILTATRAVNRYRKRTLLMVWPCYNQPWAYEALKAYKGNILVFCGEAHGGCTADNDFYKLLSKEWKATTNIDILRWPALYDYMCVYTRKKNGSSKKRN